MKKRMVLLFFLLLLLTGCARIEPYVYHNGYNRYWPAAPSGITWWYRYAADDGGTLYFCEDGDLYTLADGEKTLLLEGGEPVPVYDNVYWHKGKLYFCDSANGYRFVEYDLTAETFRVLEDVYPETDTELWLWSGNQHMILQGRLYVYQPMLGTCSYDLTTGEKRFYGFERPGLPVCDGTYLYQIWPARAWRIHLETGEATELDVSFVTEEKYQTLSGVYLDGSGGLLYVTSSWKSDEKILWKGTADDSAPCEEIPLVWNDIRIRPDYVIGEYNRDFYFVTGADVFKWESSGDYVEWICEAPGNEPFFLGKGLYYADPEDETVYHVLIEDLMNY